MSPDREDLSRYMGRKPYRRVRKSTGAEAGLPKDDIPRERVYCMGCRKFIRYKDIRTVFEFTPGTAWRMRFCQWCGTMVQEKAFEIECSKPKPERILNGSTR